MKLTNVPGIPIEWCILKDDEASCFSLEEQFPLNSLVEDRREATFGRNDNDELIIRKGDAVVLDFASYRMRSRVSIGKLGKQKPKNEISPRTFHPAFSTSSLVLLSASRPPFSPTSRTTYALPSSSRLG